MRGPEVTAREFVARINHHDPKAILALCTPEHRFIDSRGAVLSGAAALERGWRQYFTWFPDYHIEIEAVVSAADLVFLSGWASATLAFNLPSPSTERSWRIPSAWRSRVSSCLVEEWQVYADNAPVYALLAL